MNDRKLLELAAKAGNVQLEFDCNGEPCYWGDYKGLPQKEMWNPLTDDGDALRLAVKLFVIDGRSPPVEAIDSDAEFAVDPFAAARRSIVRAAAEIGRAMP